MELKWFHVTRFYFHGTFQQRMNSLNANHSPSVSLVSLLGAHQEVCKERGFKHYSDWKFSNSRIGPNMHHVNSGLIRPYTEGPDSSHGICGLSYALKENSKTAGLRCDLFISHAWDEGGPSPKRFDKGISWPEIFFLLQHQTGQMPCFHGKFPARCL